MGMAGLRSAEDGNRGRPPSRYERRRDVLVGSDRVGRDGFLRLAFERRGPATVLIERRFRLPLQALEPLPLEAGGAAVLMLLNPTGGIVGGDRLHTEVVLGPGAHCCLTTPSATKAYRTAGPPAIQEFSAHLGAGAVLEYLPDHLIPFPGSALRQSLAVELAEGSVAILLDAFAAGRVARGEAWRFAELEGALTVTDTRGLRFRDRFRLVPAVHRVWAAGCGGTEGMDYLATLLLCFDSEAAALNAALDGALAEVPGVRGGVSPLPRGGLLVRFLAHDAPALQAACRRLWTVARRALLDQDPPDLRKI